MNLNRLSPLPIVDLQNIAVPEDGFLVKTPKACKLNFEKGSKCRAHYGAVAQSAALQNVAVQCPFGFTSFAFETGGHLCCLTSLIPFPRQGGEYERKLAKTYPENKIAVDQVRDIAAKLQGVDKQFTKIAASIVERQSMALHEIRKLNRNIKHEAERMCSDESPTDPDLANPQLVKIWKSSELMSAQLDVIEILANEHHAALPLNYVSEVYRLFDKCVRIYRPSDNPGRLQMQAPYGFKAKIRTCDKTFHLIPTILIENGLKYAIGDSPIRIEFSQGNGEIVVTVENTYVGNTALTDAIFKKGIRATSSAKEGTGNGLYVASLVAQQHSAKLSVSSEPSGNYKMNCVFTLIIPEVLESVRY